jgi:hypothetical protein
VDENGAMSQREAARGSARTAGCHLRRHVVLRSETVEPEGEKRGA